MASALSSSIERNEISSSSALIEGRRDRDNLQAIKIHDDI